MQLTGGLRFYKYDNTLDGFFGYSAAHGGSGVSHCFGPDTTVLFAPCTDLEQRIADHGTVPRINLTYKFTPDVMLYATYSKGFRPGGVNRTAQADIGPYTADFLKNYEVGWKTQFFNHHLRWNGAVFVEDWDNFQYSFLGVNSVTIIENGASARITGLESNLEWAVSNALFLSANFDLLNPRLTSTLCSSGAPCPSATSYLWAPYGTNLPVTPKFKGNVVVRYTLPPIADWVPYWQGSMMYQTTTEPALRVDQAAVEGRIPRMRSRISHSASTTTSGSSRCS